MTFTGTPGSSQVFADQLIRSHRDISCLVTLQQGNVLIGRIDSIIIIFRPKSVLLDKGEPNREALMRTSMYRRE